MREIKFRVWDKIKGKFASHGHNLDAPEGTFLGVAFDGQSIDFTGTGNIRVGDMYEVMQYTGLKDENGKEIYEGDIIMYAQVNRDGRSSFPSRTTGTHGPWNHTKNRKYKVVEQVDGAWNVLTHLHLLPYLRPTDQVVVGNIYENPELLNSKSDEGRLGKEG